MAKRFSFWHCTEGDHVWATEKVGPCPECGSKKREPLPSVTSILGNVGWKCEGLKYWAHDLGMRGIGLREALDKEATVGSLAHIGIEADLKGEPFDLEKTGADHEMILRVRRCMSAWKEWREASKLQVLAMEVPLVSGKMLYGGTVDAAIAFGEPSIFDWKSGGLYEDALLQVCAYAALWNESHPDQLATSVHVLQLGKDDGSFHHHRWALSELTDVWQAWMHAAGLERLRRGIKRKLG